MNDNLKLWKKVHKTEPELISKRPTQDGTSLNVVSSIHRFKKATELFGVYGDRWGLRKIEHREVAVGQTKIGVLDAEFFIDVAQYATSFQIGNSTVIVAVIDGKIISETSYIKSLETGAIVKALSRLGFNADIYSDENLVKSEGEIQEEYAEMELIEIPTKEEKSEKEIETD